MFMLSIAKNLLYNAKKSEISPRLLGGKPQPLRWRWEDCPSFAKRDEQQRCGGSSRLPRQYIFLSAVCGRAAPAPTVAQACSNSLRYARPSSLRGTILFRAFPYNRSFNRLLTVLADGYKKLAREISRASNNYRLMLNRLFSGSLSLGEGWGEAITEQ